MKWPAPRELPFCLSASNSPPISFLRAGSDLPTGTGLYNTLFKVRSGWL
jgi:hypothetical protein